MHVGTAPTKERVVVKNQLGRQPAAHGISVLYGYRHDEVPLPNPGPLKDDSVIQANPEAQAIDLGTRRPVAVSAGCHVEGVSCPHPDDRDPDTVMAGVQKRFLAKPPPAERKLIGGLRLYVREQLESGRFGDPISPDEDVSFERWIEDVDYPDWRKIELKEVWNNTIHISEDPRYLHNKSFMKDEHYTDFKHARGINSRSDQFKCFSGPIFRLLRRRCLHRRNLLRRFRYKNVLII